jgi:transcriptional regulator with XRE-family HTH domain
MVNIDDFVNRLETLFEYYGITASGFADKIGVQRSSLSHLLSGRNKPSLDLILKIVQTFPEIDLYWILNGKGNFPKTENQFFKTTEQEKVVSEEKNVSKIELLEDKTEKSNFSDSEIERIVVFYKNGTFRNYTE